MILPNATAPECHKVVKTACSPHIMTSPPALTNSALKSQISATFLPFDLATASRVSRFRYPTILPHLHGRQALQTDLWPTVSQAGTFWLHLDIVLDLTWSLNIASTSLWSVENNPALWNTLQFWRIIQRVQTKMWSIFFTTLRHCYTKSSGAALVFDIKNL